MYEQLVKERILHLSLLLAAAIFIYQYTNWEDGLWIPISVLAIMGPFRPGLAINKAYMRILGTFAGLLISVVVWVIMRYSYSLIFIYGIIAAYCVAFAMLQEYRYFITIVTVILCINFNYMNPQYYHQFYYMVNRAICVLVGVGLFLFAEYFIFKPFYANAKALVVYEKVDEAIIHSIEQFIELYEATIPVSASKLTECYSVLLSKIDSLKEIKASMSFGFSEQKATLIVIDQYLNALNKILTLYANFGFDLIYCKDSVSKAGIAALYELKKEAQQSVANT